MAACQPPTFDPSALAAAATVYPLPRGKGQAVLSGSWGLSESYGRDPFTGRPLVTGHTVTDRVGLGTGAGLSFSLTLGPGLASLAVVDQVRREDAVERVRLAVSSSADAESSFLVAGDEVPDRVPSRVITEWSGRSRSRMVKAFCSVDWTSLAVPGEPIGMVTLTYPGDWLAVAPNGKTVKRHLAAFRRRFARATGRRLDGAWKLEFQRRGAPHFHLLMPVPAMVGDLRFEEWLSLSWAAVVGAKGQERVNHEAAGTAVDFASTGRMSDPKRLAVYFLKHGTKSADDKEYQHYVPREWLVDEQGEVTPESGPGRFWGFWGMKPATVVVELDAADFVVARRALRRLAAARARSTAYSRDRANGVVPRAAIDRRRGRSHVLASSRMVGGFVVVNDGTRLAVDLARWLNLNRIQP